MANKQSKIALQLLNNQLNSLDTLEIKDSLIWRSQTIDIIKNYVDPSSSFITEFTSLFKSVFQSSSSTQRQSRFNHHKYLAKGIIESCIVRINISGAYVPEKTNFISRMSEGWAIFWSGTVVISVATFSYFLGGKLETITVLNENKELLKSKIILTDSMNILKRSNLLLRRPLPDKDTKIKHPVK